VNLRSIVEGECHENEIRKDFTPSERVAIERTINAELERRQGARTDLGQDLARSEDHRVSKESARLAGFGNRETARQARAVVEAAERDPERFGQLVEAMDRSGRVEGVFKRLVVAQKAEAISAEPPPLPTGPFRTIVADPPWFYARDDDPSHRGACPYPRSARCQSPLWRLTMPSYGCGLLILISGQPIRSSTLGASPSAPF
jgi:hypothetical protein